MDVPALPSWLAGRWPRPRGRPAVLIRRTIAATLLLIAAILAVRPATAQDRSNSPAVVSARDLTAGSVLHPADVRVVQMPNSLRPAGTISAPNAVDGRLLAGSARAGEPLTDARLVGASPGIPATGDPRTSVVPVRLADSGVAALLHAGARVDVVAGGASSSEGGHQVLASMAVVVTVTAPEADVRHGPGIAGSGSLVLLELPTDIATQVAAVSLARPVTVTLR